MKYLISTLFIFTFFLTSHSQQRVELCVDKLTQLIFHSDISSIRGGYDPNYFIQSHEGNVLYIQPLDSVPSSNLYVITADRLYYVFTLEYNSVCEKFYHIIEPSTSIFKAIEAPQLQDTLSSSNIHSLETRATECLNRKERLSIMPSIINHKIFASLQNIYVDEKRIYFKISLRNSSSINYTIDYVTFYIENKKRRNATASEKEQHLPCYSIQDAAVIKRDQEATMVYAFDKFTFNNDKLFCIDIIEREGERKISFKIDSKVLLKAKGVSYGN